MNIEARIAQHIRERCKVFDSYAFIQIEKKDLSIIEQSYINKLMPGYNIKGNILTQDEQYAIIKDIRSRSINGVPS